VLWEVFGQAVSRSTVARIIQKVDDARRAFQSRPLEDVYQYLIFDGMYVRCMVGSPVEMAGARGGESVEKVAVLLVRGIKYDGTCEVIDFRAAPGESEQAWGLFLASLVRRGLTGAATKLIVHDGSEGLANALATHFGTGPATQRCLVHKLANVEDAVVNAANARALRSDASDIYLAADAAEARQRLDDFAARWQQAEPKAVSTLRDGFEKTLAFFEVPVEHRSWIATGNLIERTIRELRRRTRTMNTFMTLNQLQRSIYLARVKISDARRNQIPLDLWAQRPPGKRKRRRQRPRPDVKAKRLLQNSD